MTRQGRAQITRATAYAAAFVLAATGLAACGGGGEAAPSSSTSMPTPTYYPPTTSTGTGASGTASGSPSSGVSASSSAARPTQTPMPAAAKAHTQAGAVAFARYFTEAMGVSFQTGSSKQLRTLFRSTCEPCTVNADRADAYGAKGEHAVGTTMKIFDVEAATGYNPQTPQIDVLVQDGPYQVVDARGDVVEVAKMSKANLRHHLAWTGDGWIVDDSFLVQ